MKHLWLGLAARLGVLEHEAPRRTSIRADPALMGSDTQYCIRSVAKLMQALETPLLSCGSTWEPARVPGVSTRSSKVIHSFPFPLGAEDGGPGVLNKPPPIHLSPPAFQRRPKAPHWRLGLLGAVVINSRPTQAQCQTLFVWRCACTGPPLRPARRQAAEGPDFLILNR